MKTGWLGDVPVDVLGLVGAISPENSHWLAGK